jgi:hypothetical protein
LEYVLGNQGGLEQGLDFAAKIGVSLAGCVQIVRSVRRGTEFDSGMKDSFQSVSSIAHRISIRNADAVPEKGQG